MSFMLPPRSSCRDRFYDPQQEDIGDASGSIDRSLPGKPFSSSQRSESASTSSTSISESSNNSSASEGGKHADYATLQHLFQNIGYADLENVSIESVSGEMAFCNSVYRMRMVEDSHENETTSPTKTYYAKLFRPLALSRMTASLGTMDRLVSAQGLAPRIITQTDTAILFDECQGRILTEKDCHSRSNARDCGSVGKALALLHTIQSPSSCGKENIIWKACESMLSLCHDDYSYKGYTLPKLAAIVQNEKDKLESLNLPLVSFGHGDCKPCNIFVLHNSDTGGNADSKCSKSTDVEIRFIDLELAGWHYRAFDLAKFFRTDSPTEYTKDNQHAFYEAYLQQYTDPANTQQQQVPTSIVDLEREVKYLLPMTWLEAAIFFVCMACQDEGQADRWNTLAIQRLESYQTSILDLERGV